ncbi:threonine synthase [Roseospira marina]|uniref:Threonine synthase n=1 Tax=Roseospira marina TaxID=140057 RepID=A0A5M6IGQ6_9PROT|nr:threonine synthase [Roseospira marina]KAA5607463.1 threonine synthase [Roseospira marina]MBB4312357.1 threonine synthase [Roseospira marina]MBB5085627.1 threonine synthase [Roseospira marina]
MRYVSTRGAAPVLGFDEVVLAGLAADGGLYVPEEWPSLSEREWRSLRGLSHAELALRVMLPFVGAALTEEELADLVDAAYARFDHPAVAPLRQIGPHDWMMELFHGPTLAFKDHAMQVLGPLFDLLLTRAGRRVTIVGATSGDTGSAAIEACRDRDAIDVFILHPKDRVSEVQRRQMTTVQSANVHNIAVNGTFDDCQALLKSLFADATFRDEVGLSAVNSINWARIMAQVVYYAWAGVALGAPDRSLGFSVPTGNFGNVFAGYVARQMGLPIDRLVVGSNRNDILSRFLETGTMQQETVIPTLSPSMDIQVSSNFERLLFEMHGRDSIEVRAAMESFRQSGSYSVPDDLHQELLGLFRGHRLTDEETSEAMRIILETTGELVDPHTAIGIVAGQVAGRRDEGGVTVSLATAHPAKFPDAVEKATGIRPPLPSRLADLYQRSERLVEAPNDTRVLQQIVRDGIRR